MENKTRADFKAAIERQDASEGWQTLKTHGSLFLGAIGVKFGVLAAAAATKSEFLFSTFEAMPHLSIIALGLTAGHITMCHFKSKEPKALSLPEEILQVARGFGNETYEAMLAQTDKKGVWMKEHVGENGVVERVFLTEREAKKVMKELDRSGKPWIKASADEETISITRRQAGKVHADDGPGDEE